MNLIDRLKKAGSVDSFTISESNFFNERDQIPTKLPILNVALGGELSSGITPGLLMVAGESGVFKTAISLYMVAAYQEMYPDAICIYYDSEFGSTPEYLKSFGVDPDRTIHVPLEHIEHLKFDIIKKLEEVKRGDKVIILIDSVGNLASKKEVEDAQNEKAVADMTRAKQLKSLWRMVTPHLTLKDIPCLAINHVYSEQGSMYPQTIVSGGTGGRYSANAIWIITKSQEKDADGLTGFNFTINIFKSRTVIEKSKLKFTVKFKGGIDYYSGMFDLALESGYLVKPSQGWYQMIDKETGEILTGKIRSAEAATPEILGKIMQIQGFRDFVKQKYKLMGMAPLSETDQVADEDESEEILP